MLRDSTGSDNLEAPAMGHAWVTSAGRGKPVDLATIPNDEPAVYDLLCRADTIGTFHAESRPRMATLPIMKPRCFFDLAIEVAIIHPSLPPLPMPSVNRPAITSSLSRHGVISKPPRPWQIDPVSNAVPPRPSSHGLPPDRNTPDPIPPDNPLPSFPPTTPAGFSLSPIRSTVGP
jgi:hypothetical protein